MNKKELLSTYWGHDTFRPFQEEIIDSVLANQDTFAVLPTGGGKSLCFQIPALMMEGFVLVISPLIALMEDQVKALKDKGIKAMYFESDPKGISLSNQLDNAINGNYKVVFVSPERLTNTSFLERLKFAKISLIAVDEAHCISEWGHDFRPAYRKIGSLRSLMPKLPILALTASATPEVKKDIETLLDLKSVEIFQGSFERYNIGYQIWNTEDKFNSVIQLLKYFEGSSIVYCYSRKQTEILAEHINQHGLKASCFHGGLLPLEKKQRLQTWQEGRVTHMIATTAFGMGIDKSNVRTVIHTNLPESIENYYQETGRAGRDGKPSNAFLLYHQGDFEELEHRIFSQFPEKKELTGIYKDLCNFLQIAYGEGQEITHALDLNQFSKRYHQTEKKLHQCLIQLEKTGVLHWHASKTKQLHLRSKSSPEQALQFVKSETTSSRLMEFLMRQHSHFFSESIRISMQSLCAALTISVERLEAALHQLKQQNLIDYTGSATTLYLSFQVPREDQYTLRPTLELLKKLKSQKLKKFKTLKSFVSDDKQCKRNFILNYFGEENEDPCQNCSSDSCKQSNQIFSGLRTQVIELLQNRPHSIQELKQKLYFEPKALEMLFSELLEQQQISKNSQHKFYWIDE